MTDSVPHMTPGPWHVYGSTIYWIGPQSGNRYVIATLPGTTNARIGAPTREIAANALAISAVPDLLDAARQFVHRHEQVPAVPVSDDDPTCVCGDCARFKNALAKAEGKPDPFPAWFPESVKP